MSAVAQQPPAVMRTDMRWHRWTRSEIIALAQQDACATGYAPSHHDWASRRDRPAGDTVIRYCGSWNEMIAAAGLTVLGSRRRYTRERVLILAYTDVAALG